jgi:hypothetical protein
MFPKSRTNHRIRRLPQARLLQGRSRAIVSADHFNVRQVTPAPSKSYPLPIAFAIAGSAAIAALGSYRVTQEWKMGLGEGVLLFVKMLCGPLSAAFLFPVGGIKNVISSPTLVAVFVICLVSFSLPFLRRRKNSFYFAAFGAVLWILSGNLIMISAAM